MIFRTLITFIFIVYACISYGQQWCGFDSRDNSGRNNLHYPVAIRLISEQAEDAISYRSERWIQVVVHVVTERPYDISEAKIREQIEVLNRDFAGRSDNIFKLEEEFQSLVSGTGIRFCLASLDPGGNPTSGITYTQTDIDRIALKTDINGRYVVYYDQLGGKTGWDPERYINIWIAEFGNGILGYGSFPGTASFPEEIGIVMDPAYFGSFGTGVPFFDKGHSLTHEMGHYLGLVHIWGDDDGSCDGSDEVDDTPNAANFYLGCPLGAQVSCGVSNMYENFMDLTDDRCLAAFTHGQASRMQATVDLFYPGLTLDQPCAEQVSQLDEWWDSLIWAYEPVSDEYVAYSHKQFENEALLEVFSSDGRKVIEQQLKDPSGFLIDLDATPGIYFVLLTSGDLYFTRKLVVY